MLDETILEELDFAIENGCDGEFLTEVKKGYTDLYNRWCECLQREKRYERKIAMLHRHYQDAVDEI